jgi:hypothetical protein
LTLTVITVLLYLPISFANSSNLDLAILLNENKPIHFFLPFTKQEDLVPCETIINIQREFNKALQCANNKVFYEAPLKEVTPPTCFIVKKTSPDIHSRGDLNYLNVSFFKTSGIVGFYEERTNTTYLVENIDIDMIYRHEMGHYFLKVATGDGNGAHDHIIWQRCEPPRYSPSSKVHL